MEKFIMNKNIRIAKELIKIAKSLMAGNQIDAQTQERLDEAEKQGKKYILHHKEEGLWKIMACKDFYTNFIRVKKGDFGGLIEKEENLSHEGKCWVFDDAHVQDSAQVYGDALIFNYGLVCNKAKVFGDAWVYEYAQVRNDAHVSGKANKTKIHGTAIVRSDVKDKEITE